MLITKNSFLYLFFFCELFMFKVVSAQILSLDPQLFIANCIQYDEKKECSLCQQDYAIQKGICIRNRSKKQKTVKTNKNSPCNPKQNCTDIKNNLIQNKDKNQSQPLKSQSKKTQQNIKNNIDIEKLPSEADVSSEFLFDASEESVQILDGTDQPDKNESGDANITKSQQQKIKNRRLFEQKTEKLNEIKADQNFIRDQTQKQKQDKILNGLEKEFLQFYSLLSKQNDELRKGNLQKQVSEVSY